MAKKLNTVSESIFTAEEKSKSIPFHLNLIGLAIAFFIILIAYKNVPSYSWLKDELIKENLKVIKKYPRLSIDEKLGAKIGYDYHILKMIRDATPENAIILMPRADTCYSIRKREGAQNLNGGGIHAKIWSQYYLYPRKMVYEDSKDSDLEKANYVAIIGGHGYEKLNSSVKERVDYTVYELK